MKTKAMNAVAVEKPYVLGGLLLAAALPVASYGWSWADKSGDVTLEAGVTRVTNEDITYVAALTGIEIPSDASLVFENTQSLTLSASLSGAGAVYSGTAGTIVFAGDNSAHTGSMAFTNMNVTVTHRYGLGSATRAVEHSNARLLFKGNGLTNDVPLVILDNRRDQDANTFTENWTDPWRQNGHVDYYPKYWSFGSWTFTGGLKFWNTIYTFGVKRGCRAFILDEPFISNSVYLPTGLNGGGGAGGNPEMPMVLTLAAPGCSYKHFAMSGGTMYNGAYDRGIICGCENTLDSEHYLGLGWDNKYGAMLDLNGYDQKVPQVRYGSYNAGWNCTPTRGMEAYCLVKSDTAAKLTMTENRSSRVAYRFSGGVSLRQEGSETYTILNQFCDTTGRLEVVKGAVAFDWEAGWGGDVDVSGTGKVKFLEGSSLSRSYSSHVAISGEGKIYVTNGVELICSELLLGEDSMSPGTYSASNKPEWMEGDGSITVLSLPDPSVAWSWAGKTGDIVLPPGVVTIADADIPDVENVALTRIRIPGDGCLVFENTQSLTLSASLFGAGAVCSGTAGTVVFAGDNSEHTGPMAFTNMNVTVTHRYGLGSATRAVEHCNARLLFKGNGLTNDVPLVIRDNRRDQSNSLFTENWTDPWRQNGHVDYYPNWWYFGSWTFAGGLRFRNTIWTTGVKRGCHAFIIDKPLISDSVYLPWSCHGGGATAEPEKPMDLTLAAPGCSYRHFALYGGPLYNGTYNRGIVCGCENTLDTEHYLGLGMGENYGSMLDLNGYDQIVPQVHHATYHVGSTDWRSFPTRGMEAYCLVKSDTAAKLTMTGNDTSNVAFKFSGGVSLRQEGTGTYTILNQYCDTTGRLEVVSGAVAFDWEAGWGGDVEVFGSGTAKFLEGSKLNRSRKSAVTIHDGGKLYVTNGVELRCASLVLGSNELVPGRYTAAEQPGWITGEGAIRVCGGGFTVILR